MPIQIAPVLEGRHCRSLSFVASLRPLKPVPKREDTIRRRYQAETRRFICDVNDRFVGAAYTALTGESLRHSFRVSLASEVAPARVSIWLTCPQGHDFTLFHSEVLARWRDCPVAGEHIFVDPPRTKAPQREPAPNSPRIDAAGAPPRRGWWQRTFGDEAVTA
jgi:hypothetical protein